MAGGESTFMKIKLTVLMTARNHFGAGNAGEMGEQAVTTIQTAPITKEREKLRVAKAERKRPKRSKEKDFMSSKCCNVGGDMGPRNKKMASRMGKMALRIKKVYVAYKKYYVAMVSTSNSPN
jgi:hypothetical protein